VSQASTIFAALFPVFAIIAVGFALDRLRVFTDDMWRAFELLCYYLLFPVLIVKTLAGADLSQVPFAAVGAALIAAILTQFVLLALLRPTLMRAGRLSGPSYSSVFQGATRWHGFAALAIIATLFGPPGITVGAVAIAAIVPLLNVAAVIVVSRHSDGETPPARKLAMIVIKNPFIVACAIGVAINGSGLEVPAPMMTTLDLIGRGALGLGLLIVGAALRIGEGMQKKTAIVITSVLKLIVLPCLIIAWTWVFGVEGLARSVAILCGAVPTAAASFVLARQLGGDATLSANILTFQVLAAAITLPVILLLAGV